ncbi:MAG: HEAT repeat domain-containing protein [Pirellulales bacterium]|nr:HEAT repeat domain-containing protein [Pirellulales bacterium]
MLRVTTAFVGCLTIAAFAPAWAAEAEPMLATISVPEGFVVEQVAGPPLVEHPMMASFDPQGRLYVADSAGFNLSAEELLAQTPNRILRLEDTDGDGRFDRRTVFADRMTFPMGAQWYRGAVYVASPPSIWRLEDVDGDGVAERREELVTKFGFIGNAADIHGCFLGPDGRIYWCDGRHGHHFTDGDGQTTSQGQAARIFSCLPDGSNVEALCGGGMDNPVELAFAPEGDVFGTMTFYNPDDHRHDAIVHFIHGGVYPRKHSVVQEFKRTGDFMPPLCLFETVAPAGLLRYQGRQFPDPMRGNLFSVQFNTHQLLRHPIARSGATWSATTEPFLASSHIDFHPTDVLEDADGSLLVIDTGGWFRHGCPTSQVAKPDVLGAIYRVRYREAPPVVDPRGLTLEWEQATTEQLLDRLNEPRPAVLERAIDTLALRGDAMVAAGARLLADPQTAPVRRRNALWALTRANTRAGRHLLRAALRDPDLSVQLTAARATGTLRDREALVDLLPLLASPEPVLRREAATALGRIGQPAAVPALLEAVALGGDRFLEHALIFALIEINDRSTTLMGLDDPRSEVRRAALIALDQMDDGQLQRDEVVRLLDTSDFALQQAVLDCVARHEGWAGETVGLLGTWLADAQRAPEQSETLRGALVAFAAQAEVEQLIAAGLGDEQASDANRLLLLEAASQANVAQLPDAWKPGVERALAAAEPAVVVAALAAAARRPEAFIDELLTLAADERRDSAARVRALELLAPLEELDDAAIALLVDRAAHADSALERLAAARALGAARLDNARLLALTEVVAGAGPLELPALLAAFELRGDVINSAWLPQPDLGLALVKALDAAPGRAAVPQARLAGILAVFPTPEAQAEAMQLMAEAAAAQATQAERLAQLEPHLAGGDAERGAAVFQGRKAGCAACHRVGSAGETIGPDLSHVGQIRAPRDLLESIVLPSVTLARGYETVTVATSGGQSYTGVISRETVDALELRNAQREVFRIARGDIAELAPNPVSIMPQGLDQVLTPQELADLVAYLHSLK